MSYSDKLKDPRWQKKRLEILNRDNFQCQYCLSKEKELHVHHRYYKLGFEVWEYPNNSLITLCLECHKQEEIDLKETSQLLIQNMKEGGCDSFHIGRLAQFFTKLDDKDTHVGDSAYTFIEILYTAFYLKSVGNTEIYDIYYDVNYNLDSKRIKKNG